MSWRRISDYGGEDSLVYFGMDLAKGPDRSFSHLLYADNPKETITMIKPKKPKKLTLREQLDRANATIQDQRSNIVGLSHTIERLQIKIGYLERDAQRVDKLLDIIHAGSREANFPRRPGASI